MRLATLRHDGADVVARLDGDHACVVGGGMTMRELVAAGAEGLAAAALDDGALLPLSEATLLTPVPDPSKVVAIGLNYRSHAEEVGAELPAEPMSFAKFPSSLVGHGAVVSWSESVTRRVDYEAELVVVIGRAARNVERADALGHVFGYTCGNDVSARDLQVADGQWTRAKSLDTFGPVGPWIVTADEIPDPQALRIRCEVGGEVLQDQSAGDMIFDVAELIARLSRAYTLLPGDLLLTGTPAGIGAARKPRRFLRDGDRVAVEIDGIGRLENVCVVNEGSKEESGDD